MRTLNNKSPTTKEDDTHYYDNAQARNFPKEGGWKLLQYQGGSYKVWNDKGNVFSSIKSAFKYINGEGEEEREEVNTNNDDAYGFDMLCYEDDGNINGGEQPAAAMKKMVTRNSSHSLSKQSIEDDDTDSDNEYYSRDSRDEYQNNVGTSLCSLNTRKVVTPPQSSKTSDDLFLLPNAKQSIDNNYNDNDSENDDEYANSSSPNIRKVGTIPRQSSSNGNSDYSDNEDDEEHFLLNDAPVKKGKGKPSPKKKKKKVKDPNAPKGAKGCYIFYSVEQQPKIREQQPGIAFGDLVKIVAASWKVISDEDKAVYEKLAKEDKERFVSETAKYERTKKEAIAMEMSSSDNDNDNEDEDDEARFLPNERQIEIGRKISPTQSTNIKSHDNSDEHSDNDNEDDDDDDPFLPNERQKRRKRAPNYYSQQTTNSTKSKEDDMTGTYGSDSDNENVSAPVIETRKKRKAVARSQSIIIKSTAADMLIYKQSAKDRDLDDGWLVRPNAGNTEYTFVDPFKNIFTSLPKALERSNYLATGGDVEAKEKYDSYLQNAQDKELPPSWTLKKSGKNNYLIYDPYMNSYTSLRAARERIAKLEFEGRDITNDALVEVDDFDGYAMFAPNNNTNNPKRRKTVEVSLSSVSSVSSTSSQRETKQYSKVIVSKSSSSTSPPDKELKSEPTGNEKLSSMMQQMLPQQSKQLVGIPNIVRAIEISVHGTEFSGSFPDRVNALYSYYEDSFLPKVGELWGSRSSGELNQASAYDNFVSVESYWLGDEVSGTIKERVDQLHMNYFGVEES